ncbi:MAG TPA: glycosyltransferase family 39 protein [Planctomycetaceae bacterium]|jgi:dolichyl-phosphate-mannose-protein mannosyltransferase|nr:glycosyltransferase family 39 protein [Planctomycetaceae bacterium]
MSPRKPDARRRASAKSRQSDPATTPRWSPRTARPPIDRGEKLAIGVLFLAAIALRFSYQTRISIEHWDEAVNASNLLLDGGYPNRFLYSPPFLPALIEWSMLAYGKTPLAAVMPSLVLGSLTIPLCWWVGREWFGPKAGVAAAALAALSDFQIVYSRTALTDAALGFWFLLAVYCSWRALARNHLGEALFAGLVVACAWATKYNGWLPLAVALSGFIAWGVFERFDLAEWKRRLPTVATIFIATAICWSPVWFELQPEGGYSAVTANHAQYFFGLHGWWDDFKRQILNQRFYEDWLTAAGMILAWLLPVVFLARRGPQVTPEIAAAATTEPSEPAGVTGSPVGLSEGLRADMSRRIHLLTVAAGLAGVSLLVAWIGFGAVFVLLFLAFVGFATLGRSSAADQDDDKRRARNLAGWLLAAWFIGLFVAVPLYKPYPRLVMPWLVCAWIATGACIDQVLTRATARRAARDAGRAAPAGFAWRLWLPLLGSVAMLAVGIVSRMSLARTQDIPGWQDRAVRARVIKKAAAFASKLAPGRPLFLVYGEPALFFDLAIDNANPQPPLGGDFSFLGPGQKPLPQPAYLLAYSGTADFDKLIAPYEGKLKLEAVFHDTPSDLVLLDTYSPADLAPGKPRPPESLNLYRIQPH